MNEKKNKAAKTEFRSKVRGCIRLKTRKLLLKGIRQKEEV